MAVATEIGTGREIWLTKGPLVNAIRASYALPGIFRPVQINGRWLMDGAFVNPVPVAVCRAMGANLVIAVNLHHLGISRTALVPLEATAMECKTIEVIPEPPIKKTLLPILRNWRHQVFNKGNGNSAPGISRVLLEAFNVTQDRIARARLAGDPPDVIITPRLGAMGLFDFHKSKLAIAEGYEATMRQLDEITRGIGVDPRLIVPVAACMRNSRPAFAIASRARYRRRGPRECACSDGELIAILRLIRENPVGRGFEGGRADASLYVNDANVGFSSMLVTHILGSAINAFGIRTGESPKYDVIHEDGELAIRRYPAFLRARTLTAGDYTASSEANYKRLASYISGHNSGNVRLYPPDSLTQSNLRGESIAMTTPVLQAPVEDGWTMAFILPEEIYLLHRAQTLGREDRGGASAAANHGDPALFGQCRRRPDPAEIPGAARLGAEHRLAQHFGAAGRAI